LLATKAPELGGEQHLWHVRSATTARPPSVFEGSIALGSGAPARLEDVRQARMPPFKETSATPIVSAVRYLSEAFELGLRIPEADAAKLRAIADGFDPKSLTVDSEPGRWLTANGASLLTHAEDLEGAWSVLDGWGLRAKLAAFGARADPRGTLGALMDRVPVKRAPVGQGPGKTAAELGYRVLSHETSDFGAYVSMTRSWDGHLNAFASRGADHDGHRVAGERAAFGGGGGIFFTIGPGGGFIGNGQTLRVELDPKAVEGVDFTVVHRFGSTDTSYISDPNIRARAMSRLQESFISVLNAAAVRLVPERGAVDPVDYVKWIVARGRASDYDETGAFSNADPDGALDEVRRREAASKLPDLSPAQHDEMAALVRKKIDADDGHWSTAMSAWFKFPESLKHPELLADVIARGHANRPVVSEVLSLPQWLQSASLAGLIDPLLNGKDDQAKASLLLFVLPGAQSLDLAAVTKRLVADPQLMQFATLLPSLTSGPAWLGRPDYLKLVEQLLQAAPTPYVHSMFFDGVTLEKALKQASPAQRTGLVQLLTENASDDERRNLADVLKDPRLAPLGLEVPQRAR
jgi:hypothetical protein